MPRRDEPLDLDDDDRPRRRRPPPARSGIPVVVWVLAALGGMVALGCGGLLMLGLVGGLPKPQDNKPLKWGEPVTFGSITLQPKAVRTGGYMGSSPVGQMYTSSGHSIMFTFEVTNSDRTRNVGVTAPHKGAEMRDTHGNRLRPSGLKTELGVACRIEGQMPDETGVRADEVFSDMVPFEWPVPDATTLFLHVPARNFGGTGVIVYEVPAEVWKK